MGKVKYATGIDYVSGSLSKPKKKDGHSCGTYLTGTHRTAATENNKITTDQQNFAAQKDQAGGKKTMKAYLWKVCGDEYDAAHNG